MIVRRARLEVRAIRIALKLTPHLAVVQEHDELAERRERHLGYTSRDAVDLALLDFARGLCLRSPLFSELLRRRRRGTPSEKIAEIEPEPGFLLLFAWRPIQAGRRRGQRLLQAWREPVVAGKPRLAIGDCRATAHGLQHVVARASPGRSGASRKNRRQRDRL